MFFNIRCEKSGRPGQLCDILMACGHYLGRGLKSPPTHIEFVLTSMNIVVYVPTIEQRRQHRVHVKRRSLSLHSTTGTTSSAVIVTLWTTCSLCHDQLSSPGPRAGPTCMTKRAGGPQCNDDSWTCRTCCRTGLQSYSFDVHSVLLLSFDRRYIQNIHSMCVGE